jgi:hypothetical protein
MRYMTQVALGALLSTVLYSTNFGTAAFAAEEKPWWHLGMGHDATTEPAPSVTPAPTMTPAMPDVTPVEDESWLKWPSLPKFGDRETTVVEQQQSATAAASPQRGIRSPFGKPHYTERPKNTWAQQPASDTTAATKSPWQSMSDGTKNAWRKTVDWVTPGDGSDVTAVDTEPRVSMWDRMWGGEEEQQGPETVTEWMAQDRLDP